MSRSDPATRPGGAPDENEDRAHLAALARRDGWQRYVITHRHANGNEVRPVLPEPGEDPAARNGPAGDSRTPDVPR